MATVKRTYSFTCPKCDKTLRTAARPAEGKKIRCPACSKPFVPELDDDDDDDDEDVRSRIQPKPTLKAKAKAKTNASKAGAKKRRVDDDDDDDRPAKKKKKPAGSNMLMIGVLVVLGGGMLMSVGLCGVGAFVWPGFLKADDKKLVSHNMEPEKEEPKKTEETKPAADPNKDKENKDADGKKKKEEEPKKAPPKIVNNNKIDDFVLAQSPFLLGANIKTLRDGGQFDPILSKLEERVPELKGELKDYRDLVRSSDQILVSALPGEGEKFVVAVLVGNSFAVTRFKKQLGQEEKLAERYSVYRPAGDDKTAIVFPGDRLVLFAKLSNEEVVALLDAAAEGVLAPSPAAAFRKGVDTAHVWGAYAFDDMIRSKIPDPTPEFSKDVPLALGAAQALQQAKGGSFALNFTSTTSGNLKLIVDCSDSSSARNLKEGAVAIQDLARKGFAAKPDSAPASMIRDFSTIKIQQGPGNTVWLTMQGNLDTINDLTAKSAPKSIAKNDPPPPTKKDAQVFTTTAVALVQEFRANAQPARDKYRDNYVEVSGKVMFASAQMVVLDGGEKGGGPAPVKNVSAADFDKTSATNLAKLKPGQLVTLRGQYRSDAGDIGLTNCRIVSVQPAPMDIAKNTPKYQSGQVLGQFALGGIGPGQKQEKSTKLDKGQTVVFGVKSLVPPKMISKGTAKTPPRFDTRPSPVHIEILRGQGNTIIAQASDNGTGQVVLAFTAPEADNYRIRIHNSGPHTVAQSVVIMVAK